MDLKLSKKQALLIYVLLFSVEGEEPTESQFKDKFKADPKEHKELFDTKLVEHFVKPRGRTSRVRLTDSGWMWAEKNLGGALNTRSPAGTKALQVLLGKLKDFIAAKNLRLADLLSTKPEKVETFTEEIRAAYLRISGGTFDQPIAIADLGKDLAHIPREAFLNMILELHNEGKVFFTGKDDPLTVTEQDRQYTVHLLGFPKYKIAFKG